MDRLKKKIAYGIFYLAVLILITGVIFLPGVLKNISGVKKSETKISCSDGLKNNGETGIDCGGPCVSCPYEDALPLALLNISDFISASGEIFLSAEISNPNDDFYASSFSYAFKIFGADGFIAEALTGSDTIPLGERKFIYRADVKTKGKEFSRAELEIGEVLWRPKGEFSPLRAEVSGDPVLIVKKEEKAAFVHAVIKNTGVSRVPEIRAVAVLRDQFGFSIIVTGTIIARLVGFETREITIPLPYDENIAKKAESATADVYLYPVMSEN